MDYPSFESIWSQFDDFEFSIDDDEMCIFAKEFGKWVEDLCERIMEPNLVAINQAKVQLLDKYFEWRNLVPKIHRNKISQVGHQCIFHVFETAYILLRAAEVSLMPPMLFVPPPPPPPPPPTQIAGLFLGEIDE